MIGGTTHTPAHLTTLGLCGPWRGVAEGGRPAGAGTICTFCLLPHCAQLAAARRVPRVCPGCWRHGAAGACLPPPFCLLRHQILGVAICSLRHQVLRFRFAEVTPVMAQVSWEVAPWGRWRVFARSAGYEALVEATCARPGTPLRAPTATDGLAPFCRDSFHGQARAHDTMPFNILNVVGPFPLGRYRVACERPCV